MAVRNTNLGGSSNWFPWDDMGSSVNDLNDTFDALYARRYGA